MKQSVRTKVEEMLSEVIPDDAASDFNQGLIELGAIVCVPNGTARCGECPLNCLCEARKQGRVSQLPVKSRQKGRRVEEHTVFIFRDGDMAAIKKRPDKGLLAGLYELPNLEGHLSVEEVVAYSKRIGLTPVRVKELGTARHIFSHVEWQMQGFLVQVDELEKSCTEPMIFVHPDEVQDKYPIPAAFERYTAYLGIKLGQDKYKNSKRL